MTKAQMLALCTPHVLEIDDVDPADLFVGHVTDTDNGGLIVEIQDGEGWCPTFEITATNHVAYLGD